MSSEWSPHDGMSVLTGRELALSLCHVRIQREKGSHQNLPMLAP